MSDDEDDDVPPPPAEKKPKTTGTTSSTTNRRELARQTKPIPCYRVEQLPSKYGGDELYDFLKSAVAGGHATLKETLEIPPKDARSWKVPAGCLWRIICHKGPQVADMNCWALGNTNEKFYSSKTRQIHATHLSRGDRLWSSFPYLRPMATIVEDTIDYGFDDDGAGVHDVIGSRCDPYTNWYMTGCGENFQHCCHSNLTRHGVRNDRLQEGDIHDVLNVFMCTGFTKDTHQYFTKPSPVDVGDYIEFLAEIDLLVSASTCPQGDVSVACGDGDVEPVVFPLKVEVYELKDKEYLKSKGWKPSPINGYSGNHGL